VVTLALKTETAHLLCHSGRVEVLLGPSGSGKAHMLHLLAGLDSSRAAQVFAGGTEVTHLPPGQREVRFVPAGGVVYPALSVLHNLVLPLRGRDAADRARAAAARFGLHDVLEVRAGEVDASTRQRIGFAKALASGARAVLLEEPFAAIDSTQRVQVCEQVVQAFVARDRVPTDRVLVIATANAQLAQQIAGHVHVVSGHRLLQRGTPAQLWAQPASEEVAAVLYGGTLALWPVMVVRDRVNGAVVQLHHKVVVEAPPAWSDVPPGPYRLGLPPSSVRTHRRLATDVELRAEVMHNQIEAGESTIGLRSHDRDLSLRQAGYQRLPLRQTITVFFSLADTLLFSPRGRTLQPVPAAVAHGPR
jgi:multiple sugar transport system ATP-binding protein